MSLDQNLFTLNVTQRPDDRNVADLVDAKGVAHYMKRRVPANEYRVELYDPVSESLLVTVSAPSPSSKHKTIQLYNPDTVVELKYTGTLSFKWGFKWEDHEYEWKREECYMLRKPDPAILVAVTKEPPGRIQTRAVQILDYNLNRVDIEDRKGLEIVMLTALLTFADHNEAHRTPREANTPTATTPPAAFPVFAPIVEAPPVPPKPAPRSGADRVAELHAIRTTQGEGEANDVFVGEECSIDDYAQYAARLLQDEAMLLVSIRSASAAQVPTVLRVVEETKRARHRSGIAEDEGLHQYVIYDTDKHKGPRRIKLDGPDPNKAKEYVPPTSVIVHLSKIDMPELRPKVNSGFGSSSPSSPTCVQETSDKERRKAEKKKEKERKKAKVRDATPTLTKPSSSSSFPSSPSPPRRPSSRGKHTPAHQTHPHQPSPSPSQLNNPGIYAAAVPPPIYAQTRPVSMAFPTPSFYGSGSASGYDAPVGSAYTHAYSVPAPQMSTRPSSYLQPASASGKGQGPVSALLEMWSKHQ